MPDLVVPPYLYGVPIKVRAVEITFSALISEASPFRSSDFIGFSSVTERSASEPLVSGTFACRTGTLLFLVETTDFFEVEQDAKTVRAKSAEMI
jgi:hypothetical protein